MRKPLLVCLASVALAASAFAGTASAQSHGGGHYSGTGATHVAAGHGYYGGYRGGYRGYYGPRFHTNIGFYFGLPFFFPTYYPYYGPAYAYPVYTDYPAPVIYEDGVRVERVYRGAPEQAYRWYCADPAGYFPQVRTCNKRFMKVSPDDGSGPPPAPGGDSMADPDGSVDEDASTTTS